MGFLDDIKSSVGSAVSNQLQQSLGAAHPQLMHGVLEMIGSQGLHGLIQNFKDQGLGEVVSSWVGTGSNLPISADQLKSVLGSDKLQQLAAKVGIPPEQAAAALAHVMPGLVDKLTPHGKIEEGAVLQSGLNALKGAVGGA